MGRGRHDRSISFDTARSLDLQSIFESQSSLEALPSVTRPPRDRTINLRGTRSSSEKTPHGRAKVLNTTKSCNIEDLCRTDCETPRIKEARKDALTAKQQVRSRILKAWAVRHWAALLLAALLLLLVVMGVRNMFHIPGRRTPGPSATEVVLPGRGGGRLQNLPRPLRAEAKSWLRERGMVLHQPGAPLGVCIMTADFWGLKTAGGTATAYHLLAQALAARESLQVTFLGVTRHLQQCQESARASVDSLSKVRFRCLEPQHFLPEMVETSPFDALSHAALAWLRQNLAQCDMLHLHEWGGAFVDVITASAYRQLKPGLRTVVETHGGHFWSTQGSVQRPLDVVSLRIDQHERMGLQLADVLISPTHYMTAFLRQRGWRLPRTSLVIPNVVPSLDDEPAAAQEPLEKPVWRLAFYSRLEERKGIKMFIKAVNQLTAVAAGELDARFEVFFIGSESRIDMRPSTEWLRDKTASWTVPVHIMANVPRSEALQALNQEGMLLVMCSLVDNMPYVLAEAAVEGIPLLAFDIGGIHEMLDFDSHSDVIVYEPTVEALVAKLQGTLKRGLIKTVRLSEHMMSGRESWLKWHERYATLLLPQFEQDDLAVALAVARGNRRSVQVMKLRPSQAALELHKEVCGRLGAPPLTHQEAALPLLLLPHGYSLIDEEQAPSLMSELLLMGATLDNGVGALTFGVEVPSGKRSWPSGPTWLLYGADDSHCLESVPLLLRKGTFCDNFMAQARVFRTYQSWVLAMMLRQAGLRTHTYPEVLFKATNMTAGGSSCNPDAAPTSRHISFGSASNVLGDPEEMMVNLHLAPFPRPVSSLVADYPLEQSHKGWQIGYRTANSSAFRPLVWHPSEEVGASRTDGSWGCPDATQPYPAMHHSLVHPCVAGATGPTCCGYSSAAFNLRFLSFVTAPRGMLLMAYEVWPICGDGMDLEILHTDSVTGKVTQLMLRQIPPDAKDKPQRQKVEIKLNMHAGDLVDFVVHPHANMDCDGVYIVDMQFWQESGDARTWETRRRRNLLSEGLSMDQPPRPIS